jgi:hypothetical protein
MRMAKSAKLRPKRAALLAQTAVALEILLMAPIRIRKLIQLDLDRHLVRPARIRGALHIVILGEEVKNRAELDYPLPEESATLIGRYIEHHRPLLASAESRVLFPGPGRRSTAIASAARGFSTTNSTWAASSGIVSAT